MELACLSCKRFKKLCCFVQQEETVFILLQALGPKNTNGSAIDSCSLSFITTTSIDRRYIAEIFCSIINLMPTCNTGDFRDYLI